MGMGGGGGGAGDFFELLWILLQYLVQAPFNIKAGALGGKNSNSWELLLNVVTESFVLNVTGLVDLTLKRIDKIRLRQFTC